MSSTRRDLLFAAFGAWLAGSWRAALAGDGNVSIPPGTPGNFSYIYGDPAHRKAFSQFLENVFHLYPVGPLHERIREATARGGPDRAVYAEVQGVLPELKPFLADLTLSLPALRRQKEVMADQTVELLGDRARYDGYLEFGSTGRYLDALEERLGIAGECFTVAPLPPSYSPPDMLDRGQVFKAGQFLPLDDYRTDLRAVAEGSIDLVTVYIGFHHCPVALREQFLGGIRRVLRPRGAMIVRDHDAVDERMWRMVALAHDVFNMGTMETWSYNERELRNFYSLADLDRMLAKAGFRTDGRRLLQAGDPTRNTLMLYRKA